MACEYTSWAILYLCANHAPLMAWKWSMEDRIMASVTARQDQDGITIGWQVRVRKKGYPVQTRTFR